VLVSVPRGREKAFTALCAERGVPWEFIGVTDPAGGALEVHGQFRIGLDELREAHTATLPRLFGGAEAARVEVEATRTGTTPVLPATAEQPVDVDPAGSTPSRSRGPAPPQRGPGPRRPRPRR
jgi:phosphoribosylformylglycinamidine synthase